MDSSTSDHSEQSIDWEDIIVKLCAYAHFILNQERASTTRVVSTSKGHQNVYLKGNEIMDYVQEAICRYLTHPEKYDPTQGDFLLYLKYNLIRSLISNDNTSSENKKTDFSKNEDIFTGPYQDRIIHIMEKSLDNHIDYKIINSEIETAIVDDAVAEQIYFGLYLNGMTRKDIIESYNIDAKEYDNGVRRLNTIINRVSKKYTDKNNQYEFKQ